MRIVLVNGITFVMWADRLIVCKDICFGTIIGIPPSYHACPHYAHKAQQNL